MSTSYLHYEVIKKLGEGGMGIVYLAEDTKLRRKVALKFLPHHVAADPEERKRFEQEAQAAARLSHRNIAQVYAIEKLDDELFIVMEYVEGSELRDIIEKSHLSTDQKITIAKQIAEGIKKAHEKGIIHRDIKTRNIMIDSDDTVKIMDFGLARVEGTAHITKTGTTVGTTAYMAPELLAGQEADARSDIWSLGVVLYELFTGSLPFRGVYEPAIIYSITEEDPIPFSEASEEVPERITHVISRALEKEPNQRYQNIIELLDDLLSKSPPSDGDKQEILSLFPSLNVKTKKYLYLGLPILFVVVLLFANLPSQYSQIKNSVPDKKYLAVLPIENIGNNPELQAICEGLAEMFSYKLSEIEQYEDAYWVTPASEIRKEQVKSATQANRLFGVNLAISSTLQTMQDSTRLILELVDADKIRRLSTEQVIVASNNLSSLERDGVKAMLSMLNIDINPNIDARINEGEPSKPEAYEYYLKGRASLQNYNSADNLDKAITQFQQAIAVDPGFALAHAGLGETYWWKYESSRENQYVEKAEQSLYRALALNAELAPIQSLMGLLKSGTGKYEAAVTHFLKAIKIDPKYDAAYSGLAKAYDLQGQSKKAVNTYRQAIELKPDYWVGYKDLGIHFLNKGEINLAINQFQKVLELTPKNSTAYSNLGVAYYYNGQNDLARHMFERSLAIKQNPLTANNLAGIYYWEERYVDAAKMYEIALEAYENRYEIWGNLAAAYEQDNQEVKALQTYLEAIKKAKKQLEVNPNNPEILADLGAYYSDVDDSVNAMEYITKALALNDENIRIRQRAVSTYEQLGMRDEALNWIMPAMTADIEAQPELENLVQDERYVELKMNFTTQQ